MKITILMGSPNKNGSTSILANEFKRGAEEAGHTCEVIDVCHANIHPCIGCVACGYEGPCVQNDDVEMISSRNLLNRAKQSTGYLKRKYRMTDPQYALVAEVERTKLGLSGNEYVPIVNLKVDDLMFRDMLIQEEGIIPAYHMNKQHWITVLLDGSVQEDRVYDLLEMSFMATASRQKKQKIRPPKEWFMSLHLGLHWNVMMSAMIKKRGNGSKVWIWILRIAAFGVKIYI